MSPPTFVIGESDDFVWFRMKQAFHGMGVLNDHVRARSSGEALTRIRVEDGGFPVVVLNLSDSLDTLDTIRADALLRPVVVILLGTSDEAQILDAYQRGANSYIIRPTDEGDWLGIFSQMIAYWTHTALLPQRA